MEKKEIILTKKYFLYPSALIVPEQETLVTTLLGSCVSICLYDPVRMVGGINHFMLPVWKGPELPTDKYGDIAFGHLLKRMINQGAEIHQLKAKIFGGANQQDSHSRVGIKNIQQAKLSLAQNGIEIIAESTGGTLGRKIIFDTSTGQVKMWYLRPKNVSRKRRRDDVSNDLNWLGD